MVVWLRGEGPGTPVHHRVHPIQVPYVETEVEKGGGETDEGSPGDRPTLFN